jgi:polyhydroxybutyrate depolymerase
MRWTPPRGGPAAAVLAAVLAAGCGADDVVRSAATTTTATAPTSTAPPATAAPTTAAAPRPLGRNDHRLSLKVGGERRTFLLHTPPGSTRSRPLPLVVALHMRRPGANGKVLRDLTGLDAKADRERFLVAYPDGIDGGWNAIVCCSADDDVGFIRALVEHLQRRWHADPDRVYATGASNGAAMSYRLAAALPGVFAAIAPVSGALIDVDVPEGFPRTPVSLVAFHGRQDTIFDSMSQGVAAWRRRVGCPPPMLAAHGGDGTVTRAVSRCRNGTTLQVYELAEMGHAWPGATADDPMAGPDTPVSANDLIWQFFERHPRRR